MQLAHLIPHLDAEIDRLQRARDLLEFHQDFLQMLPAIESGRNINAERPFAAAVENDAGTRPAIKASTGVVANLASDPENLAALAVPRIIRLNQRRAYTRSSQAKPDRRRRTTVLDSALTGAVPAGPVVVSAEEARRSQAAKAAQITRAAEVKKAGDEPLPNLGWRTQTDSARQMEALLQRLMNIGEKGSEDTSAGQLISHTQS